MLVKWHIKNFKSFSEQPDLNLASINVLAGANSSGKSTIIQSILLLKQTIQYGSENRSIALNGPLLRLGAFEDALNQGNSDGRVELGFEISLSDADFKNRSQIPWMRTLGRQRISTEPPLLNTISLQVTWGEMHPELNLSTPLQRRAPLLISTCLQTSRTISDMEETSLFRLQRRDFAQPDTDDTQFSASSQLSRWEYGVELDELSKQEMFEGRPEATIEGGYPSYFLPGWVTTTFNSSTNDAMQLAKALCDVSGSIIVDHQLGNRELPAYAVDAVNLWLIQTGHEPIPVEEQAIPAHVVREAIKAVVPQMFPWARLRQFSSAPRDDLRHDYVESLARLEVEVRDRLISLIPTPEYDDDIGSPRISSDSCNFIREFFKQGVRYLGPLRDSPRPVYQLEALESTTDVGYRGEHTAAILDLNGTRLVSYICPPAAREHLGSENVARVSRATLHDAAVEWLSHLGVANDVRTNDAGVFGHQLQVTTDAAGRLHDLTNVGVGVSQLLPIVVMALLAPKGSLLIFEQPELHLHPKVQARLADFFISLAQQGKQLILETHSEYLIDRFRLRIAQSQTENIRSLINILFSEKVDGQSRLTPVQVNEYGAITNWPKDFFEQSQQDVNAIIQAASEKRRTKTSSV